MLFNSGPFNSAPFNGYGSSFTFSASRIIFDDRGNLFLLVTSNFAIRL